MANDTISSPLGAIINNAVSFFKGKSSGSGSSGSSSRTSLLKVNPITASLPKVPDSIAYSSPAARQLHQNMLDRENAEFGAYSPGSPIANAALDKALAEGKIMKSPEISGVVTNTSASGLASGYSYSVDDPIYFDAPYAEKYGMDMSTAYSEALANTAHQREVQDLIKAGLNPVLSSRYGGSAGVSGASVYDSFSGSGSVSDDSSSAYGLSGIVSDVLDTIFNKNKRGEAAGRLIDKGIELVTSGKSLKEIAKSVIKGE